MATSLGLHILSSLRLLCQIILMLWTGTFLLWIDDTFMSFALFFVYKVDDKLLVFFLKEIKNHESNL